MLTPGTVSELGSSHLNVRGKVLELGSSHLKVRGKVSELGSSHLNVRGKVSELGSSHLNVRGKVWQWSMYMVPCKKIGRGVPDHSLGRSRDGFSGFWWGSETRKFSVVVILARNQTNFQKTMKIRPKSDLFWIWSDIRPMVWYQTKLVTLQNFGIVTTLF